MVMKIYLVSVNDSYREAALKVADGFIDSRNELDEAYVNKLSLEFGLSGKKVVVVSDDFVLCYCLKKNGAIVTYYSDSALALKDCSKWDAAAVFLDVEMPGIPGFDIARKLRKPGATA